MIESVKMDGRTVVAGHTFSKIQGQLFAFLGQTLAVADRDSSRQSGGRLWFPFPETSEE
jgi:hypothetical protein